MNNPANKQTAGAWKTGQQGGELVNKRNAQRTREWMREPGNEPASNPWKDQVNGQAGGQTHERMGEQNNTGKQSNRWI